MDEWTFHCKILGVSPEASEDEIKKAHLNSAKILHPDKHGDSDVAKQKFQQLQDSYKYLQENYKRRVKNSSGHQQTRSPTPDAAHPFKAAVKSKGWKNIFFGLHMFIFISLIACMFALTWFGKKKNASTSNLYVYVVGSDKKSCDSIEVGEADFQVLFLSANKPSNQNCGDVRARVSGGKGNETVIITSTTLENCQCMIRSLHLLKSETVQ